MRSDIVIEGSNAKIFRELIEKDFYQSNTDIFFDSLMIGLLSGQKGEITVGDERVEITRTWLNNSNRSNFRNLISTFVNLEQHNQGEPLNIQEIFLDEKGTNSNEKLTLMKQYASHGIKKLYELYFDKNDISDTTDYLRFVDDDLENKKNINKNEFIEENALDKELKEILNEMG